MCGIKRTVQTKRNSLLTLFRLFQQKYFSNFSNTLEGKCSGPLKYHATTIQLTVPFKSSVMVVGLRLVQVGQDIVQVNK